MSHLWFAHIHEQNNREPLFTEQLDSPGHLDRVASLVAIFAQDMFPKQQHSRAQFSQKAGRLLGLWHDLGKYSKEFQEYLQKAATDRDVHAAEVGTLKRVDHSSAGARYAAEKFPFLGHWLAFALAGHHAGLPDWDNGSESDLKARLASDHLIPAWCHNAPPALLNQPNPQPALIPNDFACAFHARMMFSCLVDADFLSTEAFMNPERSTERQMDPPSMTQLAKHLQNHMSGSFGIPDTPVKICRAEVLQACQHAAEKEPGFFSLTVPTGGGKTLSSLSFALNHAARHDLRRVICAIPFTSIIEQNAHVYRQVFASLDDSVILEHHANLDPDEPQVMSARLAAENWDAPVVMTTNVQLFESLFANRPGRCRKLHRMARSVIVLDEAQTLPVALLEPCLAALKVLVGYFGCTVVLSTATQPALTKNGDFKIGLEGVREIMPDPQRLSVILGKRVQTSDAGRLSLDAVADRLASEQQALVIVNSRRHAVELYQQLRKRTGSSGEDFHLSALMCPQHRTEWLRQIKVRLKEGLPCRVVATQLIEAGVDVDFPVVYRALAGLDAMTQAAGRCNREGKMDQPGRMLIFTPEEADFIPDGELRLAADVAQSVKLKWTQSSRQFHTQDKL
ncbi:MAG: CRISPR-associated helicase Cas3' [Magnetococcales bacterium]|nr:CRISPR-associated helicase Cas3' [Magnetococcales bacterium]